MKIKSIHITGFWDETDLNVRLNDDVNIISGINGIGKSTLLDIVSGIITNSRLSERTADAYKTASIVFADGSILKSVNFIDSVKRLGTLAQENNEYRALYEDVMRKEPGRDFIIHANILSAKRDGESIPADKLFDSIDADVISSFDTPLPDVIATSRFRNENPDGIRSSLDVDLYRKKEQYAYFLGDIADTVEALLSSSNPDISNILHKYEKKNLFVECVNHLFYETGKTIILRKGDIRFKLKDGKEISIYRLSSGEKQMLYILLSFLLQEDREYIVFLDEPELSLHVSWQKQLIGIMLKLNPNAQIIMATHAPSVILAGWGPKVFNLEDVITHR